MHMSRGSSGIHALTQVNVNGFSDAGGCKAKDLIGSFARAQGREVIEREQSSATGPGGSFQAARRRRPSAALVGKG
jgi:hypothetical protein